MIVEIGKIYKTRNGRKAHVVGAVPNSDDSNTVLIGYVETADGLSNTPKGWAADGKFTFRAPATTHYLDLVEVWVDKPVVDWSTLPAWAQYAAMDFCGEWFWFRSEPYLGAQRWMANQEGDYRGKDYGQIPTGFLPGFEAAGDWKQSLVHRGDSAK